MSGVAQPGVRVSSTAVFRKRDFALLWVAQLVSTAGSSLTDLAAAIYVFDRTGSALLVGVTLMATAVPSLIVGLLAGVFVDRYDRRLVMICSNLAQAVIVGSIPFLLGIDVSLLFAAILVNAGVKQFFDPAYESLIPEIASDEELTAANAFLSIASFGSTAIGFAGAGLLASIDIRFAFWIDALTFLFSAGCVFLLSLRVKVEVEEDTSVAVVIANLRTGVRTITGTPMIRSLFLLGAPAFFAFGLWNVLLLPMAIRELRATEFEYGLQEGLTSIGFVVGSLFMARYADRLQTGLWVFVGCVGMGIAGIFYGLSPTIWIAILWVMVSGFFNSPSSVARQTLLQRNTPRELRGRVFSALFVVRDIIFLAGMAGAGLADVINVRVLLIFSSLIVGAVGVAALFVPGIGRPAAEWRRAASALRAARAPAIAGPADAVRRRGGHRRDGRRDRTSGDHGRLRPAGRTFGDVQPPQRPAAVDLPSRRDRPRGARGHPGRLAGRSRRGGVLHPRRRGGCRDPRAGRRLPRAVDHGERRLLRRDRRAHRKPQDGRRGDDHAEHPPRGPGRRPAFRDGGPGGVEAPAVHPQRTPAANQPARPAAAGVDEPLGPARAAHAGAGGRGAARHLTVGPQATSPGCRGQPRGTGRIGYTPTTIGTDGSIDSS